MRALYTAATGMAAQELNVQVISNNIANVRTTGYKRQRAQFQDLLYDYLRRPGAASSDQNTQVPSGVAIGAGVKTASTARTMSQGSLTPTEKATDVAIRGVPSGSQNRHIEIGNGNLTVNFPNTDQPFTVQAVTGGEPITVTGSCDEVDGSTASAVTLTCNDGTSDDPNYVVETESSISDITLNL